ncbi:MAG: Dipeptidyl aminopeptidase/acylaminoacyl-peptidase [Myxococcales bacterium]|nr:Dipeptidyl aminopeptidase/acylaminoacyl-peptidase [Myxococcales bacterium]
MRAWLPLLLVAGVAHAATHPFGFDDMAKLRRLGDFDVSADGKWAVYVLGRADVDENRTTSALWLQPLDRSAPARQISSGVKKDREPRFSPDGRRIAFVSDRDGTPQLFLLDLGGGDAKKLTTFVEGFGGPVWSPDGKFLVAATEVWPDCKDIACIQARHDRAEKAKIKARVVEKLLYRHWDGWRDGKRSHLFRIDATTGEARDLTPGNWDAPPFSLGGPPGYDISSDGRTLLYASNHDEMEAASTNSDIWELSFADGKVRCLSCDNKAWDGDARYSPDGKSIAWRAQKVPGAEGDKFDLVLYDRAAGRARRVSESFADWVDEFRWSPDGKRIVFTSVVMGRKPLYQLNLDSGTVRPIHPVLTANDPIPLADGSVVFSRSSLQRAPELWRVDDKGAKPLTEVNDYAGLSMGAIRERWVPLADGPKMQSLVVTPPGFDEKKKYPALFWVHGGPQGAWEDAWSWRWNPEVLASAGYVVYMANPRGSTGYGQKFVDGVSRDWGGKVYDDLMRGADDLASLPFVDVKRIGSAGASFGGFMMNWFQGHTRRFQALFCHDGISNQEAMYGTEELWFPEHEFGGPPWASDDYRKWSPMEASKSFSTPEMIVHGERDYRVPVEQAYLMYSLLARKNVPSKMLLFPDENHWVLKPGNSRLWYASMIDWFHRWLGGAAADPRALESAFSVTK